MAPRQVPEWTIVDFIYRGYWWRNRGILILNLCLALPLLTAVVNGIDSSLINGLQILPDWQNFFGHPTGKTLGIINSAQNIGGFIGLPFTPFASDYLGRRAALFLGSIIMLAGVAMQFTAPTVKMFIAARAIIGFGLTFCTNAAPLLLIELSYPTQRGKITSLYNSSWYFGSVLAAWICFGSFQHMEGTNWSWRVPTLVQAGVPLLQVCLIWFTPESPRYLVSRGMEGKAARILAKYHANCGDERDPLVVFELAQIRHAIRMEEEVNKSTSFMSLFSTPGNRKRMRIIIAIACFSQWSGNGLVSYYINLVLEGVGIRTTETKAAINGGLQVFNLLVAYSASLLVDWVGRRPLFIVSTAGMLFSFGLWTVTEALFNELQKTAAAKATIPLIFIYYFFYDIAYSPMLVAYTLEILPYRIRAKGFAVMNLTVFLTVAFNQFCNPWALASLGWWYYVVYCGWLIIELVFVVTCIVETKGRTLEETAALFDGNQQQEDLANMGGEAATMTMTMTMTMNRVNGIQVTTEVHSSEDDINSLRSLQKREKGDGSIYEMSMVERNRASGSHIMI
ncbi:hexose transporter [Moniliophthora roreri MCA 2997]|uniref:Hexose transporter n=2 Tax=Moniliophthora roreri TaxID=221103 RepID=V2XP83_MONRO|nr:hexose transporter [Moniliophthora roreri MCA 2997]